MSSLREDKRSKYLDKKSSQSSEVEVDDHLQQMHQGASNILVAVRARPLTKKEQEIDDHQIVQVLDNNVIVLLDPSDWQNIPEEAFRQNRTREKQYAFDYAFNQNASQDAIFEKTTNFLIDGVLNGFNATVFAYGPTGAGKTYTMIGEIDRPGLMLKTFLEIFSKIEEMSGERDYTVKLSYLEIYNEIVRDLINPSMEALEIREDPLRGVVIAGLTEIMATSPEHVISSIRNGNRRRTQEPTQANETSSRSHAVLQIIAEHRDKASGIEAEVLVGKLNLIDLAGSERAANTKNRGLRLIEGANINRSLLALGNCINALCEMNEKNTKVYVPYRDSKLTRLLKDSLGGNCRTVMIACISPYAGSFEDTYNTLLYANRAKNIKTTSQRNVVNVQYHIARYTSIISQLRQEILDLRDQLNNRRNLPSVNIEKYQIELKNHFQEEARSKKSIYQAEQSIDQLKTILAQRNSELLQTASDKGEDSVQYSSIKDEIKLLNNAINDHIDSAERENQKLDQLEKKRKALEVSWIKLGVPDAQLAQLQCEMKDHILDINSLEIKRNEERHNDLIKQKDHIIQNLEDQLKIRDSIIDEAQVIFKNQSITLPEPILRGFKELKPIDQITSELAINLPQIGSPKMTKLEASSNKSYTVLPEISPSKIPKPRSNVINFPNPLVPSNRMQKSMSVNRILSHKKNVINKKKQSISIEKPTGSLKRKIVERIATGSDGGFSTSSRSSAKNSKMQPQKISDKFNSSPYVIGLSPRNKEKERIKKERAAPGLISLRN